ncbi:MAG: hypothetical protein NTW29_12190 [Bacteroidetes bacterium]|nr:hypothetical protein [Bacteroidota bacterium]
MARIAPLSETELPPSVQVAFERHIKEYNARITNMKATLGHALPAFDAYMQWYPLFREVERILGKRLACLYAFAISTASDCPLCSTYFRKLIIESGENPEQPALTNVQKYVLEFGASIAKHQGHIADHIYNPVSHLYNKSDIIILIAFAGQMIATNVLNNVLETEVDDYLVEYLPNLKYC